MDPEVVRLLRAIWLIALVCVTGFALIFGLMRVVNMAHGSFYLLGGYVAYDMQQYMTNGGDLFVPASQVGAWDWIVPALVASVCIGALGLVVQQLFLRWNQGQDLRQALITIAISVIIADQVIAHFHEGLARDITWPGSIERLVPVFGIDVLAVLADIWLYRTRTGMVIRAGVDDRQMTSALGVNIQKTFAIAFFVGSALAAFGATVGTSQGGVANGTDGQWLLNALIVVIIGGMGSIFGAAAGSLLYGIVTSFSASYLPSFTDASRAASPTG